MSKRRAVSPAGVIQCATNASSSTAGTRPCSRTELPEIDRAVVDAGSRVERRVAVGDVAAVGVEREQHAGLLEALADRCDAVRVIDVLAVALLDPPAGEHVHAAAEDGTERAAHHEHLDAGASAVGAARRHGSASPSQPA